uniref:Uncharacterized protein n=1 Tax=Cacopsylla melanoneura TaxID=428564 RepID=A0A8D8QRN8_9HEMI
MFSHNTKTPTIITTQNLSSSCLKTFSETENLYCNLKGEERDGEKERRKRKGRSRGERREKGETTKSRMLENKHSSAHLSLPNPPVFARHSPAFTFTYAEFYNII